MHSDEQYGHHLGVRLHRELEAVRAAPDLLHQLRRRQSRRAWALRAAIATPVAVAALAAVLVTTTGLGAPNRTRQAGTAPDSAVQLQNVAYVRAQAVMALSRASQFVISAKSTYENGYYEEWIDKATQRYRNDVYGPASRTYPVGPDGQAVAPPAPDRMKLGPIHLTQSHSVSGPAGNQNVVTVDYDLKTWWMDHTTDHWTGPTPVVPDPTDPDKIREAINDGTLTLLGEETVDGLDTLHLRMFAVQRGYRIDLWVDTKTFLPVRETATVISEGTSEQQSPKVTTKYSWLPRTAENLAHLVLTPPPGFKHVK